MFVVFVIQNARNMRRIMYYLRLVWLCHIIPHYLINSVIFGEK